MAEAPHNPGARVAIVAGAFAGMTGDIASPVEVVARWPDTPASPEVERGEAVWVVLSFFGRDVPVLLAPGWVADPV